MRNTLVVLVFMMLVGSGCKKNQAGGSSSIKGTVAHHGLAIPYSRVFIKFNATEFPGADTTKYDVKIATAADGSYSVTLYQGSYYIYGYGYDATVKSVVAGGVPYKLRKNEEKKLEVPVTEL
jgi:hypothetical protein